MPTAIIVDDERHNARSTSRTTRTSMARARNIGGRKNGEEAIQLVQSLKPDFAFLDIRMPVKTGIEAAKEIADQTNIIFITAYDQYAIEAFDQGAIDYILKPADPERLSKTAERLKSRLNNKLPPNDISQLLIQLSNQIQDAPKQNYHTMDSSIDRSRVTPNFG